MGTTTSNIGIYIPADGETNYGTSFAVGMNYIDTHDHSGPPHGGVPITSSGIANHSITGIKLNANCAGNGLTYDSGTNALDVSPDSLSITLAGGNVATIKASNADAIAGTDAAKCVVSSNLPAVFASPPALGSTAPNAVTATDCSANDYQIFNYGSGSGYLKFIASASKIISSDGNVIVASGNNLSGIFSITWNGTTRKQTVLVSISSYVSDTQGNLNFLANDVFGNQVVFAGITLGLDASNVPSIVVAVGNRNSETVALTVTAYAASGFNVDTDITLFPNAYVLATSQNVAGMFIDPTTNILQPYNAQSTTGIIEALRISNYKLNGAAGDNAGVFTSFYHTQANGSHIQGANIYTKCPNNGTNVQTTSLAIQTNNLGSLADSLVISGQGYISKPQNPSFFANLTTNITGVTGDSTLVNPIIFNTAVANISGSYNAATGIFTAPVTGTYVFASTITLSSMSAAYTGAYVNLLAGGTIYQGQGQSGAATDLNNHLALCNSWVVFLTSGQTAQIQSAVTGGAKNVGILAASGSLDSSFFSGNFLG